MFTKDSGLRRGYAGIGSDGGKDCKLDKGGDGKNKGKKDKDKKGINKKYRDKK